ncbi:hypothetical protein RchiOBHm_Chr2g0167341 [Rosa chinensis]|uniref:GOLD domain-containing protein n=1 Tax=Rosa chinensis TaxID=74649 RepID=A0A2P6S4A5_ROSCH|nr:transmembrane emp24 domain-containing protein p24delta9 [Rosa chinensis]PRQ53513.1 hypothetical protein RchiOBHm_Chr2g0167341 [Rosa chinensis]
MLRNLVCLTNTNRSPPFGVSLFREAQTPINTVSQRLGSPNWSPHQLKTLIVFSLEPSLSDTMSPILICTFLILCLMSTMAVSMRFDLQSGATKCISDEIKSNSMTVGKYSTVNPNEGFPLPDTHKVTVRVTSPNGNNYHHGDLVDTGNFAFTAAETGDYSVCFWVVDHKPPTTVTIDFDWKTGVEAKDWSKVAKKGQIEMMELELKKLFDTVTSIHDEMFYLREREEEMQQLNRATNSKMATFSFLSLVVCLSVAGLQLWHLKMFFERKKLL